MQMMQSRSGHDLCPLYHVPIFGKSRLELHNVENLGRKSNLSNVSVVDCQREHFYHCYGAFATSDTLHRARTSPMVTWLSFQSLLLKMTRDDWLKTRT
jgi:hypothetical protein